MISSGYITMFFTTKGLVIHTADWREGDRILTVMTEDRGKLSMKAPGVRRKNSKLGPAGQLFAYGNMTVYENGGHHTLQDFESLEQFYKLSADLDALALASYFCELLSTEGEEDLPAPGMLRLALNSLYALANHLFPDRQIKACFELRFLAITGYEPDLWRCAACGAQPEDPLVALEQGRLYCADCRAAARGKTMRLNRAALQAARYVLRCDLKKLFSFRVEDADLRLLGDFAEAYLLTRLERGFRTLDFYHSLQVGDAT